MNLYPVLIRPQLEYCLQVWSPYKQRDMNLLEGVFSLYAKKGIKPRSFKPSQVSEDYIYRKLCKLNPYKSTGINEIPAKFLKDGAQEI